MKWVTPRPVTVTSPLGPKCVIWRPSAEPVQPPAPVTEDALACGMAGDGCRTGFDLASVQQLGNVEMATVAVANVTGLMEVAQSELHLDFKSGCDRTTVQAHIVLAGANAIATATACISAARRDTEF